MAAGAIELKIDSGVPDDEQVYEMNGLGRWVVIGIGIAGAAVTLSCGSREPTPPSGLNEIQSAGWQTYIDLNCASCHGEDREGQRSGPALVGLAKHWSAAQLVSYFADPNAMVMANPRLKYKAEQYAIGMPSASAKAPGYRGSTRVERLKALAEYMLVDVQ